jgi:uncharacterized protein YbaR (Trm112 family)
MRRADGRQVERALSEDPTQVPEPTMPSAIDPRLLEILVCPLTKGPLEYDRAAGELISRQAGLAYPVRDGIPIMLIDEARKLED